MTQLVNSTAIRLALVAGDKGGSGKSTTAAAITYHLAERLGLRVTGFDLDRANKSLAARYPGLIQPLDLVGADGAVIQSAVDGLVNGLVGQSQPSTVIVDLGAGTTRQTVAALAAAGLFDASSGVKTTLIYVVDGLLDTVSALAHCADCADGLDVSWLIARLCRGGTPPKLYDESAKLRPAMLARGAREFAVGDTAAPNLLATVEATGLTYGQFLDPSNQTSFAGRARLSRWLNAVGAELDGVMDLLAPPISASSSRAAE